MNIKIYNESTKIGEIEYPLEALGFIKETRDMLYIISRDYKWTHIVCNDCIRITDTRDVQIITLETA